MIKNIQGDFQICISVPLNKPLISTIAIKAGIQNSETAVKFIRKNLCQDLFLSMQTFSLQPYQKDVLAQVFFSGLYEIRSPRED